MRHGVFQNFSTRMFVSGRIFSSQAELPGFLGKLPVPCCTDKERGLPKDDGFFSGRNPFRRIPLHCCPENQNQ